MTDPVIISFYCGDNYYTESANNLRSQCESLGIEHVIENLPSEEGLDWSQICRLKCAFYHDKLRELKKPVMWVDVDSKINFIPDFLKYNSIDFAAFYRGFKDTTNFESTRFSRTWAPSFLYFGYSEGGLRLTQAIHDLEKAYLGLATDDFFLEEGWRKTGSAITSLPIPRRFLSLNSDNEGAAFEFGDSGNVKEYKDKVDQHTNHRLSNLLAETINGWIKKERSNQNKLLYLSKTKNLDISDLQTLLNLSKNCESFAPKKALQFAVKAAYLHPRKYESKLLISRLLLKLKYNDYAEEVIKELCQCEYEDWANLARSKLVDLQREREEDTKAENDIEKVAKSRVKMWWAKTPYPGNFGDTLNPYLIQKITGSYPEYIERGKGILAIGSVIKWAKDNCYVWGSGTSRRPETLNPNANYVAVRGPLTRGEILRNGGYCPKIFGDPALLLPKYYTPKTRKLHKVGYIPHYQHRDVVFNGNVKVIDIMAVSNTDIERFIDEVYECERIISSSLHGIIIANAYDIPARWVTISNAEKQVHGDGTKFDDYFLGVGLPTQTPLDLARYDFLDSEEIAQKVPQHVKIDFDHELFLKSFPHQELIQ